MVWERTLETLQEVEDQAPPAAHYFSDGLAGYADVYYYGGRYRAVLDKSQTYSVEGGNAKLRHYLTRLHRSTRCYSKCIDALHRSVELFIRFWNRRQLQRRQYPNYSFGLSELVSLRV